MPRLAQAVQERLVLAVRLADLETRDARVFVDGNVRGVEDLDHRRHVELASRLHDQLETAAQRLVIARPEPFPPAVGAGAVLHDATAETVRAGFPHHPRRLHDLRLAFDRARAGDDGELVAARHDRADRDRGANRVEGVPLLRGTLIRPRDGDQALDPGHLRQLLLREPENVAVDTDQRHLLADHLAGFVAEGVELRLDRRDLGVRGNGGHLDDHGETSAAESRSRGGARVPNVFRTAEPAGLQSFWAASTRTV